MPRRGDRGDWGGGWHEAVRATTMVPHPADSRRTASHAFIFPDLKNKNPLSKTLFIGGANGASKKGGGGGYWGLAYR